MSGLAVKRILLPLSALLLAMIGLGLLVTKVLDRTWPFTVEDDLNRDLAGAHSGTLDTLTMAASFVGGTPCIIAVTAIVALILRLTLHRWREPLFLCAVGHVPQQVGVEGEIGIVGDADHFPAAERQGIVGRAHRRGIHGDQAVGAVIGL